MHLSRVVGRLVEWMSMKRTLLVAVSLSIIVLAASWSLLKPGMFALHDFIHGVRIAEMTRALSEGHFPVRWSAYFGYGYGMPLFQFYAPLPYYVGSLFYWLGVPLVTAVKALFLLSTLGTVWGSYLLGKELFSHRSAGVLVAAAYTLAPYRALNLFVRGAISESWGMMALPWIFYGIVVSRRDPWKGFYATTLGLTILVLSHNLTTLIAVPFIVLFTLGMLCFELLEAKKATLSLFVRRSSVLAAAAVLALGLTAFYTIPAFFEKESTHIESTIVSGYFDYSLHFLYIRQFFDSAWGYGGSEWGPDDPISFYLGTGQLAALFFTGILVMVYLKKQFFRATEWSQKIKNLLTFKALFTKLLLILTVLALYMTVQHSAGVWNAVGLLSYIQFPWRYLSIAALLVSLFAGVPLLFIEGRKARLYIVAAFVLVVATNTSFFRPEAYLDTPSELYYDNPQRVSSHMSEILPDYIPNGIDLETVQPPTQSAWCSDGECELKLAVDRGHERLYTVQEWNQEREVTFATAVFPGWVVFADGVLVPHRQSSEGLLQATIPAGTQQIGIQFGTTPVRTVSDWVSFVSVVLLLGVYLYNHRTSFEKEELC